MEHSAIFSTCNKLPHVSKTFVCLFLSGRLRQVLLYEVFSSQHFTTLIGYMYYGAVFFDMQRLSQTFENNKVNTNVVSIHITATNDQGISHVVLTKNILDGLLYTYMYVAGRSSWSDHWINFSPKPLRLHIESEYDWRSASEKDDVKITIHERRMIAVVSSSN